MQVHVTRVEDGLRLLPGWGLDLRNCGVQRIARTWDLKWRKRPLGLELYLEFKTLTSGMEKIVQLQDVKLIVVIRASDVCHVLHYLCIILYKYTVPVCSMIRHQSVIRRTLPTLNHP